MAWPYTVRKKDLRIEFLRGSGAGGQHRNKTDSACRMTHLETGEVGYSEDERHQLLNKKKAFQRLAEKLAPLMKRAILEEQGKIPPPCKDRIRTYHEKRGTVVDHRVPGKTFNYQSVLDGNLTPVIAAVQDKLLEKDLANQDE